MRILYMHRSMADGGEGVHIRAMIDAFRARGHEVRVLAPGGDTVADPGAVTSRTAASRWLSRVPAALVEVGEVAYGVADGWRARIAAREFRPHLIYARHAAYTVAPLRAAAAAGVPLLLEVNSPLALERSGDELRPLRLAAVARRQERRAFAGADHLLAVSTPLAQWIRQQGITTPVAVVPNGIHPDAWRDLPDGAAARARLGLAPDAVVVGFVGFIRAWHGVEELLRAAGVVATATGKKLQVLVVGDGPALADLRRTGAGLAAPATVHFTGRVAHAQVAGMLAAMDIAVSPRSTFYACPLKLIEYMAAGTAVLASHADNILDVLEPERDGLTFTAGDDAALAGALRRLVESAELRQRLGTAARERALHELTWDGNARRVEEIAAGHGV